MKAILQTSIVVAAIVLGILLAATMAGINLWADALAIKYAWNWFLAGHTFVLSWGQAIAIDLIIAVAALQFSEKTRDDKKGFDTLKSWGRNVLNSLTLFGVAWAAHRLGL